MIKNERQYRITRAEAQRFERSLQKLEIGPPENKSIHPKLWQAQIDGLRSQLSDLQQELSHYEALRSGKEKIFPLRSLKDLPSVLIQARIAANMTHEDLAQRLGLKEQQIQRYEATDYNTASLARVAKVVKALGLQISETVVIADREK